MIPNYSVVSYRKTPPLETSRAAALPVLCPARHALDYGVGVGSTVVVVGAGAVGSGIRYG
jgi:threonine dehydrogenase-like Zn-dependent dehydrogenase